MTNFVVALAITLAVYMAIGGPFLVFVSGKAVERYGDPNTASLFLGPALARAFPATWNPFLTVLMMFVFWPVTCAVIIDAMNDS